MPEPLTARQQQVYDFILACIDERQCPPSVREIAAHIGASHPNSAVGHLNTLERKGYIERDNECRARSIRALVRPEKRCPHCGGTLN